MHPALRISTAPIAKSNNVKTGGSPRDANATLHQHGHKSNQMPTG